MRRSKLSPKHGVKKAVVLIGHGSKARGFQAAMKKVAADLSRLPEFSFVQCAYLEINSPSIEKAVDFCVKKGASEILALPYFLLLGNHVVSDIPQIISGLQKKYRKKARIVLCPYLGYDKRIVAVVKERLQERTRR